jgi:hypothetical protein
MEIRATSALALPRHKHRLLLVLPGSHYLPAGIAVSRSGYVQADTMCDIVFRAAMWTCESEWIIRHNMTPSSDSYVSGTATM